MITAAKGFQPCSQKFLDEFDEAISVKKGDEETSIQYIAMEYIPGATLRSTMSAEGFYPDEDRVRDHSRPCIRTCLISGFR